MEDARLKVDEGKFETARSREDEGEAERTGREGTKGKRGRGRERQDTWREAAFLII